MSVHAGLSLLDSRLNLNTRCCGRAVKMLCFSPRDVNTSTAPELCQKPPPVDLAVNMSLAIQAEGGQRRLDLMLATSLPSIQLVTETGVP